VRTRIAGLEGQAKLLASAKLANVALGMVWGFVVTFVFVRLLPLEEFRAFLLLVAFANFTVSAEFGFSTIVYTRLRAHVLGRGASDFRVEELGVLLAFMVLVVAAGAMMIGVSLAAGWLETQRSGLFLSFYGVAALNLIALLAKRALAALDRNLWWEVLDFTRRISGIALLLLALAGLPLLTSVLLQLCIGLLGLVAGLVSVHRALGMAIGSWLALRVGSGHVRRTYLADMGRTMALTVSDVAAYNAPYFTIAAATPDPRPLLLFDFIFKMSRALSAVVRALTETMLPRLTRAGASHDQPALAQGLGRLVRLSLLASLALGGLILLTGPQLSAALFDGALVLSRTECAIIAILLFGLTLICVSVYARTGMGRFASLLTPSFLFVAGSLASVPVAMILPLPFGLGFAFVCLLVHLILGAWHGMMLRGLAKGAS
jgi:O-antigen/teichoic acid export membrane protein